MVNFNPIDKDYKVRWQSKQENTKERPLHKIKANLPHWAEFEILWNGAFNPLQLYFQGLVQNCGNYFILKNKLPEFCTKPSICRVSTLKVSPPPLPPFWTVV